MKFMLMMHTPSGGPYQIAQWSQSDIQRHIRFMKDLNDTLTRNGELAGAEGLAGPDEARLVRASQDGRPATDGVCPESKEFLAGYWIVDVDSLERACAIAAEVSLAPGVGGAPLYLPIEVRQVMSAPPLEGS